jgi:hypothetical protein
LTICGAIRGKGSRKCIRMSNIAQKCAEPRIKIAS